LKSLNIYVIKRKILNWYKFYHNRIGTKGNVNKITLLEIIIVDIIYLFSGLKIYMLNSKMAARGRKQKACLL
jgi:hypothetical protein